MDDFQAQLALWAGWGAGVLDMARGGGGVPVLRLDELAAMLDRLVEVVEGVEGVSETARARGSEVLGCMQQDAGPNGASALEDALQDLEFGRDVLMTASYLMSRSAAGMRRVAQGSEDADG